MTQLNKTPFVDELDDTFSNAGLHNCIGSKPIRALRSLSHYQRRNTESRQLLLIGSPIREYASGTSGKPEKVAIAHTRYEIQIGHIGKSRHETARFQTPPGGRVQDKMNRVAFGKTLDQSHQVRQSLSNIYVLKAMQRYN